MTKRILQIGFTECGAASLYRWFQAGGVTSLFGDGADWRARGHRVLTRHNAQLLLHANLRAGRSAYHGLEEFRGFFGMDYAEAGWVVEPFRQFARLAEDDPEALFILNTGDRDDWLQARIARDGGRYLERAMQVTGMSRRGVLNLWSDDFHRHHDMVRDRFRAEPERPIEFDIQHTPIRTLARFVRPAARMWGWRWPRYRDEAVPHAA